MIGARRAKRASEFGVGGKRLILAEPPHSSLGGRGGFSVCVDTRPEMVPAARNGSHWMDRHCSVGPSVL
jgi:hypothetical protein